MKCMLLVAVSALLASCAGTLSAQTAPTPLPTQTPTDSDVLVKSPADLYKEAMHPLNVVRSSLDNWSDAELGALTVGMRMAAQDCAQTKPNLYQKDDLYALVQLCAFGQDWTDANAAALAYVASREDEHRAQAYAASVGALIRMQATDLAVQTAREMLRVLPYDAEVANLMYDLKDNLVQTSNPAALSLAQVEHPLIVTALKQGVAVKALHGDRVVALGVLYESAMQLAFLERYSGNDAAAAAAVTDIQAALPASASLSAEDRHRIEAVNNRYGLLGTRLPAVTVLRALQSPTSKAQIDLRNSTASIFVLFPDWCVGCRNMMKTLTQFATVNRDTYIYASGLAFADDSVVLGTAAHEENFKQLAGTRTLVVPDTTTQTFGSTDYPLGVVTDVTGTIRFIGPLPTDAFNGDGYISKVIVNMVERTTNELKKTSD